MHFKLSYHIYRKLTSIKDDIKKSEETSSTNIAEVMIYLKKIDDRLRSIEEQFKQKIEEKATVPKELSVSGFFLQRIIIFSG